MSVTIEEVRAVAESVRGPAETYNSCYRLNEDLKQSLQQSYGIDADLIEGEILGTVQDGFRPQQGHFFLFVPRQEVEGMDSGFILDITADQFTEKNKTNPENDVQVSLEDVVSPIPRVVVAPIGSELYPHYSL